MTENQRREWLNKYLQTPEMKKFAEDWGNEVAREALKGKKTNKTGSKHK